METHGRFSTSTGSTYSLLTAYREPVVTIGNASDIDPLTVEIRCIHVGAARGDPHVRAGEIVQTQRWVGSSVPGAPSTEIARTVRVGVAHTPRAFLSALHGAPYCGIARVSGAQRTSRSCGRPPAYPPTRRPRRCTGCAVRSAHSCRNASAGGTRASSSPRGDAMYHRYTPCKGAMHTPRTHHANMHTCHAHTMHAPRATCQYARTIVYAMSYVSANVNKRVRLPSM